MVWLNCYEHLQVTGFRGIVVNRLFLTLVLCTDAIIADDICLAAKFVGAVPFDVTVNGTQR